MNAASRRLEWILIVVAAITQLWLMASRTLVAIWWAAHDDHWFLLKAISILNGDWLGPYNHMTLIKGVGYPLWVAFISSLHIPLLFAQQLLYTLACLAVCRALAPSFQSSFSRLILFVVLLFNPMSFMDGVPNHVSREGFYPALTLLVFAGAAGSILRLDVRRRDLLGWVLLFGFAFVYAWHTREEGLWLAPLLAFATLALLRWMAIDWKTRWRRGAAVAGLPVVIFVFVHTAIAVTNRLWYGALASSEGKSFLRAYGSLSRVRQYPSMRRVPVPKEVRERVYAVSTAFAELRPFLEGELGATWRRSASDIDGGHFTWAFREAVEKAGYYKRGARAVTEYYDRITGQIEAARLAGRLDARPGRASILPPLLKGQRLAIVTTTLRCLVRMPSFPEFSVTPSFSEGSDVDVRDFAEITRSRLAPTRRHSERLHLLGWILHADGPVDISIQHSNGTPVPGARVTRLPSPDVYERLKKMWKEFPPARRARFDIEVPLPDAYMVLSLRGREIQRIALDSYPEVSPLDPNVYLSLEPEISSVDAFRLRVLYHIGRIYQVVFPPLFVLASVLYLLNVRWLVRREEWPMAILIAGLASAIFARTLMLSILHVLVFDALTGPYQGPAYALLLIVGVATAQQGIVALRERARSTERGAR